MHRDDGLRALTVCLLEPTDWPGGQLTASNVPPDFGAYNRFPVNLPESFTALLTNITGGNWKANPGNCWVSTKCFDGNIAADHAKWLVESFEPELRVYYNTVVKSTQRTNDQITGLIAITRTPLLQDTMWSRRLSEDVNDWYSPTES